MDRIKDINVESVDVAMSASTFFLPRAQSPLIAPDLLDPSPPRSIPKITLAAGHELPQDGRYGLPSSMGEGVSVPISASY